MKEFIAFIDGACSGNPGPGGFGFFIYRADSHSVKEYGGRQESVTNNIMELRGLIEALKEIDSLALETPINLKIYMDSQYVLKGAESWIHNWKKNSWKKSDGAEVMNLSLWKELDLVLQNLKSKNVKFQWCYVEGHSGNPGNERVDEIAVSFSKNYPITLFSGNATDWGVDLKNSMQSQTQTKILEYLSLVDGELRVHKNWAECESRVKGKSGVKFKKVQSLSEKAKILKEWGY